MRQPIAMESTGRYNGLLAHLAHQAGLTVYVLNARDVFFYARALGMRAKTNGVHADVIARYLAEHHARFYTVAKRPAWWTRRHCGPRSMPCSRRWMKKCSRSSTASRYS